MPIHMRMPALAWMCYLVVAVVGCGNSNLGEVSGRVTLDGKPVDGATVEFQPMQQGGSPSIGITDGNGEYTLKFTREEGGAAIGIHTVRITLPTTTQDDQGNETVLPQKIPARYNDQTTLEREVESGSQTIDFELTTGNE